MTRDEILELAGLYMDKDDALDLISTIKMSHSIVVDLVNDDRIVFFIFDSNNYESRIEIKLN